LRGASKAPLAVAGILALPLFFVGLMAFTLKLDKPSKQVSTAGKVTLGDPTKGTVGTIYLAAFGVAGALVLLGVLAMLLRSRLASVLPAVGAIAASILLVLPLGTWAAQHTKRYPLGVDNLPKGATDIYLPGEWEQRAKTTAEQIGFVTIGLGVAAIVLTVALDVRRRRGREPVPVAPPPAGLDTGGAPPVTGA
jgi:hypothetical protein